MVFICFLVRRIAGYVTEKEKKTNIFEYKKLL